MYRLRADAIPSRLFVVLLALFSLWCLGVVTGCNGGGDSADASVSSSGSPAISGSGGSMTGVAAIGRALDGYAYIQDVAGTVINVPIGADGTYSADTGGMLPPFIVRVQASDARVWYSYAPSRVPANVSQLTTLVLFLANGKRDLDELFAHWPQRFRSLTDAETLHAQAVVNLNFSVLFELNGLDHRVYNFFTMPFTPDGTGFDAVLDAIGSISFGNETYRFSNAVHQAAFDENIVVADQAMLDSLAASANFDIEVIEIGPISAGEVLAPPPLEAIGACSGIEYICPAGGTCAMVECSADDPDHASGSEGVVSTNATWTDSPVVEY